MPSFVPHGSETVAAFRRVCQSWRAQIVQCAMTISWDKSMIESADREASWLAEPRDVSSGPLHTKPSSVPCRRLVYILHTPLRLQNCFPYETSASSKQPCLDLAATLAKVSVCVFVFVLLFNYVYDLQTSQK